MPLSPASFGNNNDELYETETLEFPGVTANQAKTYLKRLGGGADETGRLLEGIGWKAHIAPMDGGVSVTFEAHDELLDDLIRRFEEWTWK